MAGDDSELAVVPTRVGVYRKLNKPEEGSYGCPHASGGVPSNQRLRTIRTALSPREWGCTIYRLLPTYRATVVPTRVGVYRISCILQTWLKSCPHASGGVPITKLELDGFKALSPREWGCTDHLRGPGARPLVVPTRVGVYLSM